jgi:hypothetical protein
VLRAILKGKHFTLAAFIGRSVFSSMLCVRFQVLTAASMKVTAFWDIAPCSLVEVDRRFRRVYGFNH